jgi:small GTP-binding protein
METVPPASPTRGDLTYKIVVIGSAAVGKTNLLSVAARGQQFNERSPPTLEPEFVTGAPSRGDHAAMCAGANAARMLVDGWCAVKVPRPDWKFGEPNQFLRAQVWDTAGQERFQAISSSHYRRANGTQASSSSKL